MYLTRFEINPRAVTPVNMLAAPQRDASRSARSISRVVRTTPATTGALLWRLDEGAARRRPVRVSPDEPDLTHLVETTGWPTMTWQTRDVRAIPRRLDRRAAVGVPTDARTQCTTCGRVDGDADKRFGHVTARQQTHWFHRRRAARVRIARLRDGDAEPGAA